METLLRDLKQALRALRKGSTSFTVTAVIALAVGIGANTAIFSLVNTVLLREPPFPKSDRIVLFETKSREGNFPGASPAKFAHWSQQPSFEDVSAFGGGVVNWTGGPFPVQLRSERVSSAYFRLFGVPVIRGRAFNAQEDTPGAAPVVLISEGLWKSRFGSDPNIIGRTMVLGGEPHVITGIVGSQFDFQDFRPAPEVWVPFQLDPNSRDQGHYFQAAGRLKDGVTLTQAKAQLDASRTAYLQKFPDGLDKDASFDAGTLRELLVRDAQKSIWVNLSRRHKNSVDLGELNSSARARRLTAIRASNDRRNQATEDLPLSRRAYSGRHPSREGAVEQGSTGKNTPVWSLFRPAGIVEAAGTGLVLRGSRRHNALTDVPWSRGGLAALNRLCAPGAN